MAPPPARTLLHVLALALMATSPAACAKKKKPPPPPPPTVMAATALQRPITDWDDYVGRFEAMDTVDVRPRVTGYVQTIAFRDGQDVRKGQLLFVIDPRPYEAALAQARAQAARAQATLANARLESERAQKLFDARAVSQQELAARQAVAQQSVADVAAAQAQVRQAALNVGFTRVTAPLSGRISDRKFAVGNLVTQDQSVLTTIVNLDPIRFAFEGAEDLYLKYQRLNRDGSRTSSRFDANPVEVRLQDESDYRWRGRMDFVDNRLDTNSGVIRGRALIPNPDGFLTPGLFGHMRLLGSQSYPGLLLPDSAVATDQSRQVVRIVGADGRLAQRVVQTGPVVEGLRVIRSGLGPEDLVVIAGAQTARPGQKVQVRRIRVTPPDPGVEPPPYILPPASSAQAAAARGR